jgi:hypothetical protein
MDERLWTVAEPHVMAPYGAPPPRQLMYGCSGNDDKRHTGAFDSGNGTDVCDGAAGIDSAANCEQVTGVP